MTDSFEKFRGEMADFRENMQKDKLEGRLRACDINVRETASRAQFNEAFHEKSADSHKEFRNNQEEGLERTTHGQIL